MANGWDSYLYASSDTTLGVWQQLSGTTIVQGFPSLASWGPGRLDVFKQGSNGNLWHAYSNNGVWSAFGDMGASIPADPSAVSWGPNRLDVFVVGHDSGMWWAHSTDGNNWTWQALGGVWQQEGFPGAISIAVGYLTVFAVDGNGVMWGAGYNGAWGGWTNLGGTHVLAGLTAGVPSAWEADVWAFDY